MGDEKGSQSQVPGHFPGLWSQVLSGVPQCQVPDPFSGLWSQVLSESNPVGVDQSRQGYPKPNIALGYPHPEYDWSALSSLTRVILGIPSAEIELGITPPPPARIGLGYKPSPTATNQDGYTAQVVHLLRSRKTTFLLYIFLFR